VDNPTRQPVEDSTRELVDKLLLEPHIPQVSN
jgi:hypothetical protein